MGSLVPVLVDPKLARGPVHRRLRVQERGRGGHTTDGPAKVIPADCAVVIRRRMETGELTGTGALPIVRDIVPAVQLTGHGDHGDLGRAS
jgi:hypothetical protein